MRTKNPMLKLNNGIEMPALGLGVYQSPPDQTLTAVRAAIANGYRLIDTAAAYMNEKQVGEAIKRTDVAREDIFVTTKLWISDYGYDRTLHAFERSRRRLGLEYVDLYLLHWPVPSDFAQTIASFKAAEKLLADGRVRAIGVSNFGPEHLQHLIERTDIVPAVNQIELHPFFTQLNVRDANARYGIITQSWSPIGGVNRYHAGTNDPLVHPVIKTLAERYKKSPAQVILRWQLDHGFSAIPKSVHPERIAENFDVFDFALTRDDIAAVDALDLGVRGGPDPEVVDTKLFAFKIEDAPEDFPREEGDSDADYRAL